MLASVHPTSANGSLPYSTGLVVLYVAFVVMCAILLLVVMFARWPGGPEDSQDSDNGPPGGPRRGPDPPPDPSGEPALWPEFERQFGQYVARRARQERAKVGRST
jgi:hypothetical protein